MSCPPRGPPGPSVASVPRGCDNSGDRRSPVGTDGPTRGRRDRWSVCQHGPMHRVVIVGAGFAGLSAARTLVGQPVDVTIVDRRNFHTFQPLLYEVATAGLESGDVAYPIRAIFGRADNVDLPVRQGDRRRLGSPAGDPRRGRVRSPSTRSSWPVGPRPSSSGSTGPPSSASPSTPSPTPGSLRDHVLRRLEQADADPALVAEGALNFVVVGGGPTGVEVAGALAELLDVAVRHDGFRFPRGSARIIVVDGLDRLLTSFKPSASAYTARTLQGRGIELRLGHMVRSVTSTYVELDKGDRIPTRTVVWAGGVTVEGTVASRLGAPAGANGRLVVGADLIGGRPTRCLRRRRRRRRPVGTGIGRSREDLPAARPGGHPVGRPRRPPDHQPDRGSSHAAIPLQGQGHHGHHRAAGGHHRVPQRPAGQGNARVAVVAEPAPGLPGRIPEQAHRAGQLVVEVPLVGIGTPGHRGRRPRADRGGGRTGTRVAGRPSPG